MGRPALALFAFTSAVCVSLSLAAAGHRLTENPFRVRRTGSRSPVQTEYRCDAAAPY
jgi:hypothetical protein